MFIEFPGNNGRHITTPHKWKREPDIKTNFLGLSQIPNSDGMGLRLTKMYSAIFVLLKNVQQFFSVKIQIVLVQLIIIIVIT
jgi:hypothetical protein